MRKSLLAIDVGGSTTRAYLADTTGRCLGYGRNRGGNPASNDPDLAVSAMISAVEAAIAGAGGGPFDIVQTLIALAGPPGRVARQRLDPALRALGLSGGMTLVGDLQAMFASATPAMDGYCVVAGTGAGAVRIRNGVIDRVVDASGWLLGDLGSGYWFGHEAAKAAVADLEGRGEHTALTGAILHALRILPATEPLNGRPAALRDLMDAVYAMRPIELAQFAPLVVAHRADLVAARLIAAAERYLVTDFATVFDPAVPGPIALGGGVMPHLTGIPAAITDLVGAAGLIPDIRPVTDGSIGAVVLALRAVGLPVDEPTFQAIAASMPKAASG